MRWLLLVVFLGFVSGCGVEENVSYPPQSQGWHFQGRNCLSCHNVDLGRDKHLLIGGTLFASASVRNPDDLSQVCSGPVHIQFLDQNYSVVYDSRNYIDINSPGYGGKGNFFILIRSLTNLRPGNYYLRIIDEEGNTLAQSASLHTFTDILQFDPRGNPTDATNRFSCNACHRHPDPAGGAPGFLYPNINSNLCR